MKKDQSWIETFFIISGAAHTELGKDDFHADRNGNQIESAHFYGGYIGVCEFCIQLTNKFEEERAEENWEEKDWYETVDKFIEENFK